jgi:CheY-like chemotaxis protein
MVPAPAVQPRPIARALVVDPDLDTRDLLSTILEPTVQEIVHASDGAEALALAIAKPPTVVITETALPRIDGFALCACLRKESATAGAWIIVITGDVRSGTAARARAAGANLVLGKPASLEAIEAALSARPDGEQPAAAVVRDTGAVVPATEALACPSCGAMLRHERTFFGGTKTERERWEYYTCPNLCGTFRYRPRTRHLQRA